MLKPDSLIPESVAILNARIQDEVNARCFYECAANWCRQQGFTGGEQYFKNEAASENQHYTRIIDFLADWNVSPDIPTSLPSMEFVSLVDIVEKAYGIEYALLKKYNADSLRIFPLDQTTYDFLQQYRQIQNESVIEYSNLLNQLSMLDPENGHHMLWFDEEFLKKD